jgi:hypothetical protein
MQSYNLFILAKTRYPKEDMYTVNRISTADLKHDLRNYLGIGIVVLLEAILIWWLLSQLITRFSS